MKRKSALYHGHQSSVHYYSHPSDYAKDFSKFLLDNGFQGKVLVIGCGLGADCAELANHFPVSGVDTSDVAIAEAKFKYPELKFFVQPGKELFLEDESIGAVLMVNTMRQVNLKQAIKEVFRVLTPGGHLFIHFDLTITDGCGEVDRCFSFSEACNLLGRFKIADNRKLRRIDELPVQHGHEILEMVAEKLLPSERGKAIEAINSEECMFG